jgi:ribosomal protein L7/L12
VDAWLWVVVAAVVVLVLAAALKRALTPRVPSGPQLPRVAPALASDVAEEARGILARGNKIAAIKHVRERTGMGLREAKDAVEALGSGAAVAAPTYALAAEAGGPPLALEDEVATLLANGVGKIEVIRRVRQRTGWGLKEAKDAVEAIERGGTAPVTSALPAPGHPGLTWEAAAEAARLRDGGQTIDAIALVRQHTGMGLRQAKEFVEGLPPAPAG